MDVSMSPFPYVGVSLGAALGLAATLSPRWVLSLVGLAPSSPEGLAEGRATYGGLFVALEFGASYFWLSRGVSEAVILAGLCWLGAAAGRALSLGVDGARTPRNFGGLALEILIGLLHLSIARVN